jgi:DNA-binding response OmpR family regulator
MNVGTIPSPRVLVVEDEAEILESMVTFMNLEGIQAAGVPTLSAAKGWIATHPVDILVLDLGLPDGDGLQWIEEHRAGLSGKGIIICSARGQTEDRIEGARQGADLYLVKPVDLEELCLLIKNLMSRLGEAKTSSPQEWVLNKLSWTLQAPNGSQVELTRSEMMLLTELVSADGQAVSRDQIVRQLGHQPETYDWRRMEIMARRLRNKVSDTMGCELPLKTVHRFGYAFVDHLTTVTERRNS